MDIEALIQQRKAKDEYLAHSAHSPIPHHDRGDFEGLDYYEPNEELVLTLPIERDVSGHITIDTSDGQQRVYERVGRVRFPVGGEDAELTLFSTGYPGYFVPFRDSTSGKETYGAGRYLEMDPNADGTVTIDFNQAYNPLCVYNEAYSCPLPPVENWLSVPIAAGEKNYP